MCMYKPLVPKLLNGFRNTKKNVSVLQINVVKRQTTDYIYIFPFPAYLYIQISNTCWKYNMCIMTLGKMVCCYVFCVDNKAHCCIPTFSLAATSCWIHTRISNGRWKLQPSLTSYVIGWNVLDFSEKHACIVSQDMSINLRTLCVIYITSEW